MHCISVFIAKESELKTDKIVFIRLPQNFVMFADHPLGNITEVADNVASVRTDYFGGAGEQYAKLWLNGF